MSHHRTNLFTHWQGNAWFTTPHSAHSCSQTAVYFHKDAYSKLSVQMKHTSKTPLSHSLFSFCLSIFLCGVCLPPPNTQTQTNKQTYTHKDTHTHCACFCFCPSTPCFLHLHLCLSPHLSLPRLAEYNAVERDMKNDI